MSTHHTPGPWTCLDVGSPASVFGSKPTYDCIAKVYLTEPTSRRRDDEHAANLALICAAPDLFEAAKHAAQELIANLYPEEREELHGLSVALERLNAAIAKAEGR